MRNQTRSNCCGWYQQFSGKIVCLSFLIVRTFAPTFYVLVLADGTVVIVAMQNEMPYFMSDCEPLSTWGANVFPYGNNASMHTLRSDQNTVAAAKLLLFDFESQPVRHIEHIYSAVRT